MESARLVSVSLLLACMAFVGVVRTLPRSLEGVAKPADERVREEVAAELKGNGSEPVAADAVDRWIAEHPTEYATKLETEKAALKPLLTFVAEDGREHPYLADYDSYLWIHLARNLLQTGDVCNEVVDGVCRDTFTHAPVGREMIYDKSLHIDAIAALHRLITSFSPGFPLSSTSFFLQVIVGVLGVIPAFFLGKRFGGLPGAVTAALVSGLNPAFLTRSLGGDNDIWNIVLPLYAVWAGVEALHTDDRRRRVAFAVAAAVAVGLHAGVWSGWMLTHVVVTGGMIATAAYAALRCFLRQRDWRLWRDPRVHAVLFVTGIYFSSAVVTTWVAQARPTFLEWHINFLAFDLVGTPESTEFDADRDLWPSEFMSVAELLKLKGGNVTVYTTNVPLLLLAFAGAALLALGRLPWTTRQWAVAGITALVIGLAYTGMTPDFETAQLLLFSPFALAALAALTADRERDELERGAFVVVAFLGGAYSLGTDASRFVMFFAPPVGVAAAVLAGWMYDTIVESSAARVGRRAAIGAGIAAVASLVAYPVYRGYVTGRDFVPPMNDGWWQAFADIRAHSPADAIVNVWWHDGHWAKYVSERRVIADGASLRSHILFWFTRALLDSDDGRAAGMLRMLNCGSDATPYPEGKRGAYSKLRAAGLSVIDATGMVDALAKVDRAAAERLLAARGISSTAVTDILESSHCTPPPMYLVVGDELTTTAGWGAGAWDFRRAYIARRARNLPREQAIRELTEDLGYTPTQARQLYREAVDLHDREARNHFIAPELGYLSKKWIACTADATGLNICPLGARVTGGKQTLDAFQYPQLSPAAGRLRIRQNNEDGKPSYSFRTPGSIVIAGESNFVTARVPSPTDPGLAVLVDVPGRRILMAEAALLASTYTRMTFLGGRHLTHFTKVAEYPSLKGKVVTYLVRP